MNIEELVMFYPRFCLTPDGRVCPSVYLPRNYKELVPKFYSEGKQKEVEDFTEELRKRRDMDIRLRWDKTLGLTNISLGTHFGFDLEASFLRAEFVAHNLDGKFSLAAAAIAQKYVWELLKSEYK